MPRARNVAFAAANACSPTSWGAAADRDGRAGEDFFISRRRTHCLRCCAESCVFGLWLIRRAENLKMRALWSTAIVLAQEVAGNADFSGDWV